VTAPIFPYFPVPIFPRLTVCLILTVAGCGHTKTVTTSSQTLDRREIASDARSRGQDGVPFIVEG